MERQYPLDENDFAIKHLCPGSVMKRQRVRAKRFLASQSIEIVEQNIWK